MALNIKCVGPRPTLKLGYWPPPRHKRNATSDLNQCNRSRFRRKHASLPEALALADFSLLSVATLSVAIPLDLQARTTQDMGSMDKSKLDTFPSLFKLLSLRSFVRNSGGACGTGTNFGGGTLRKRTATQTWARPY